MFQNYRKVSVYTVTNDFLDSLHTVLTVICILVLKLIETYKESTLLETTLFACLLIV